MKIMILKRLQIKTWIGDPTNCYIICDEKTNEVICIDPAGDVDTIVDTIEILNGDIVPKYSGIMHCCILNKDLIETALDKDLYISFAGPITFKNTKNLELIKMIPDNKILIETDCPYLSPEPNRGKRNDSRNIKYIAQKVAEIRGTTIEDIAKITYKNALNVFKI